MKKRIIIFILLLLITGCTNKKEESINIPDINEDITTPYVDDNPIKVGLYNDNKLIKTYKSSPEYHKDVGVFNVFYTHNETLDNNGIKYNFNKYYQEYKDIDKYKIGFFINYKAEGKEIKKTILDPSTMHSMDPYLYVYLYDDIHQTNNWYSHLEDKDMNEDTLTTSIKLFYAGRPNLIEFPIKLTVLTYKSDDDFNEQKEYRGNSFYTIEIYDK